MFMSFSAPIAQAQAVPSAGAGGGAGAGGAGAGRLLYELLKLEAEQPDTAGMSASERNKQDQAILESFVKLLGPDLPNKLEGK